MENECQYVNSVGIIKSCDIRSPNPVSSWCGDTEYLNQMVSSNTMFENMSIYVCSDVIPYFANEILPNIQVNFFLFTGDSDALIPGGFIDIFDIVNNVIIWKLPMNKKVEEETCLKIANHSNLLRWYSQNCVMFHEKVEQLPIGLDYHTIFRDPSKSWRGENEGTTPIEQEEILINVRNSAKPFYERAFSNRIYVNFSANLDDKENERTKAILSIEKDLLHFDLDFKTRTNVWKSYTDYGFALSPCGNGPDCHRTWEILLMGCIPIVKTYGSNSMYKDLPVLIVNEWSEVNEQLLNNTIESFKLTTFNYDKLKLKYWVDKTSFFVSGKREKEIINPFEIDISNQTYYDNNELIAIQKKIEEKQETIINLIKDLYPRQESSYNTSLDLLTDRCTRGVRQKLIDLENDIYPSKVLYKIGNGGDKKSCFVCCTPLSNNRDEKSRNIHQSLEKVGFNGYFYLFNGGFPNPTGVEMRYAGVPYCFKIFMMLEAKKLGFEKVIWLDSACYAVNNPQRLFNVLNEDDAIFRQFWPYTPGFPTYENSVLKETIQTLNDITKGNLVTNINVCSIVFGLNFNSEKITKFVGEYYDMVKIGTPFLSYFPEEVVITAIFNKEEFKHLFYNRGESQMLFIHENYIGNSWEHARNCGYYFMQRNY